MTNLRKARIRTGLSQIELANKVGVTQATISNWERGKGVLSPAQQKKLKTFLDFGREDRLADASPFAAWLTKTRSERGWSIPELAHRAGLTPPPIYGIESGRTRNVRKATREKLGKALGMPVPNETVIEEEEDAKVKGLGALEDFDPHNDGERPGEPGIYVLNDISERPIYVGEGRSVRNRIRDHEEKFWFKRPIVESASWIKIADNTLRQQIETLLIMFLKSNAVINKQNVERS